MTFLIEKGNVSHEQSACAVSWLYTCRREGQLLAFELDQSYRGKELLGFLKTDN